jgi:hypothetical protein
MKRKRTFATWEEIHEDQNFHPLLDRHHVDTYPLEGGGNCFESDIPIAVTLENYGSCTLENKRYNIIGKFDLFPLLPLQQEGVCLTGGSLVRYLLKKQLPSVQEYDLDFFIVGATQDIRTNRFLEFVSLLRKNFSSHDIRMVHQYPSIYEIYIPEYPKIQVIMTVLHHIVEVLKDFDFSLNRVWVDEERYIRALPSAELSHRFMINYVALPRYNPARIQKYEGFSSQLKTVNPWMHRKPAAEKKVEHHVEPHHQDSCLPIPFVPKRVYEPLVRADLEDLKITEWTTCEIPWGSVSRREQAIHMEHTDFFIVPQSVVEVDGYRLKFKNRDILVSTLFQCRFMARISTKNVIWIQLRREKTMLKPPQWHIKFEKESPKY